MLALDDEMLQGWAGKALVRKATQALARGMPVEIETTGPVLVRLLAWNVVCRWMPGAGLAGMVCSCHAREPCEHRVAAIMALQLARQTRKLERQERDALLHADAGTPRTRDEVLASVGAVLREMVVLGLSRLARSTEERLRTLAVSAHGVDLPRLERLLRALADEIALFLSRDAQASAANLLLAASRIEALRCALAQPTPALVGQHRSQYDKVGDLELAGLGARRWRARSGYLGLTVYFWDSSARNWATWTEARPTTVAGFDPAGRYTQDGPWPGCPSPAQASRSLMRLMGAWRNLTGRLSGRSSTRALLLGQTDPARVPVAITRWSELAERATRLFAAGLQEYSEQDEVLLLSPKQWGPAQFDPIRQELVRYLLDGDGRLLPLILPHTPENAEAIRVLERHDPAMTHSLLGLLRLQGDLLSVEPIALHADGKIINLTLDGVSSPDPALAQPSAAAVEENDDTPEEVTSVESSSPVGALLTTIAEKLESLSESGVLAVSECETLQRLATHAGSLGLESCSGPLLRLVEQLERLRKTVHADPADAAQSLLRAHYVVRYAAAQQAVTAATATLA
jgi:hypothetical protein